MITRPLLLTAGLALLVSICCFTMAAMLSPHDWRSWGVWAPPAGEFAGPWNGPWAGPGSFDGGPTVTREFAWTGGDSFTVAAPAHVVYTPGPAAKVVVTGPKRAVDALQLFGGRLGGSRRFLPSVLEVSITAPAIRELSVIGAQTLKMRGLEQDRLELRILGSGEASGTGHVRSLRVDIAGSGDADLGGIAADEADLRIAGSGRAVIAPKARAEVSVAGSGEVVLASEPKSLETHVMGSGRVTHPPTPAATPAPESKRAT